MRAQTDRYINTVSATILALTAIIKSAVLGYFLYRVIRVAVDVIDLANISAFSIRNLLDRFLTDLDLFQKVYDTATGKVIVEISLPAVFSIGIVFLAVILLIFIMIEGIVLLFLRFGRKGSLTVRFFHQIYMTADILRLLLFGYLVVLYIINYPELSKTAGLEGVLSLGLNITLGITGAVYLILLLLRFCFHKDIVRAMTTVTYEIQTGELGDLKRTHLSGISFIFALPYAVILLVTAITFPYGDISFNDEAGILYLVFIGFLLIMMLQYFSICFCNRNLKNAME